MKSEEEIREHLKKRLKPERFIHSCNVADAAKKLAGQCGADPEKAYLAGLMHDLCKNDNLEKTLQTIESDGIILSTVEKSSPQLWHAIAAPISAREVFDVTDEEILSALRYHTTGKAEMTPMETAVYLADFISADRDYPDVETVRRLAAADVNQAVLYTLRYTIISLATRQKPIHPDTMLAYNAYIGPNAAACSAGGPEDRQQKK